MSFAAVEAALVARLRAKVQTPGLVRAVLSAADLAGVKEQGQTTPALHVLLLKFGVADSTNDGASALIAQTWLVVAAVANAVSGRGAGAAAARARVDAGTLLDAVAPALLGWRPAVAGCSPFRMVDPPAPVVGENYGYYPMAFVVESVLKGDPA